MFTKKMKKKNLKKCFSDKEWEEEEILNPNNSIGNKYYYAGIESIKVPLEGKLITQMSGYTLIDHDLRMILKWLDYVIAEHRKFGLDKRKQSIVHITPESWRDKFDLIKPFMVASFSFYGKLFTKAEGRRIKLDSNIFIKDKDFLGIHTEIMMFRHNFSAHSGGKKIEYVEVSLILDSIRERNTRPLIVRTMNQPNAFTNIFLDNFVKVCKFLLEKVEDKIEKLTKKYYDGLTQEYVDLIYEIPKKQI